MTDIHGLQGVVGLGVLWIMFVVLFRDYLVDRFRQKMFGLRDELFDYANSGAIEFNHPAYWRLRLTMNGMIQFAPRISFVRIALTVLFGPPLERLGAHTTRAWEHALRKVHQSEVRSQLGYFHTRMYSQVATHLLLSSPTMLVLTSVLLMEFLVWRLAKRSADLSVALVERIRVLPWIEDQAYEEASSLIEARPA